MQKSKKQNKIINRKGNQLKNLILINLLEVKVKL